MKKRGVILIAVLIIFLSYSIFSFAQNTDTTGCCTNPDQPNLICTITTISDCCIDIDESKCKYDEYFFEVPTCDELDLCISYPGWATCLIDGTPEYPEYCRQVQTRAHCFNRSDDNFIPLPKEDIDECKPGCCICINSDLTADSANPIKNNYYECKHYCEQTLSGFSLYEFNNNITEEAACLSLVSSLRNSNISGIINGPFDRLIENATIKIAEKEINSSSEGYYKIEDIYPGTKE